VVGAHQRLQVIDVGQAHARDGRDGRIGIARHGQVHNQEPRRLDTGVAWGIVGATFQHTAHLVRVQNQVRRAGGADDDVGRREILGQGIETHRTAAQRGRQPLRAVESAVGHQHATQACPHQGLTRDAAHLTRADQQRGTVDQCPKRLLRHLHNDGSHRQGRSTDLGLAPHPFAGLHRVPEQGRQHGTGRPGRMRQLEGRLHLAQDLVFADHQ